MKTALLRIQQRWTRTFAKGLDELGYKLISTK